MDELAGLVGASVKLEAVRQSIRRIVARDFGQRPPAVLIQGETGTGKGLVARILHRLGPRSRGAFVDVNCAAIPETLLESELFGFEQGAFTDARRAKAGLFQAAHRGTIFLDEIGLLSEGLQAKLLKVIEERTVRRLGATRLESADVWVISASNTDLAVAARERRFRADLAWRFSPSCCHRSASVMMTSSCSPSSSWPGCAPTTVYPRNVCLRRRPPAFARISGQATSES
jgi:two-component system, NtrC family, response regulator AtoC